RHYDQFGALEPGLGLARPFRRSKELRARQSLHDLPPWSARGQPTTTRDWLSDTLWGRRHGPFSGAFPPRPRNHIVPQQINVRVAIRYRTAQAIEKFGTVKRNRADQMHS